MSTKGDKNNLDSKADPWRENTIRDLKRKGFKKVVYEPNRDRVRFNTGIGNDKFEHRPKEHSAKEAMAHKKGDHLLPWLQDQVEMLKRQKPSWEAAIIPCEENWAKPEGERAKDVAPPGEIEDALKFIRKVSNAINQLLGDESLTDEQKKRMVGVFKAGMSYREFLDITARASLRAHQRHGEKRPPSELTYWKKRLSEFLETLDEKPTPAQVVNLCVHFSMKGEKMSEGVLCNGETITDVAFRQELKRSWDEK